MKFGGRLPRPGEFRVWNKAVAQNVNAASDRPNDKELVWAMKIHGPDVTGEMLQAKLAKPFSLLEKRLSAALQKIVHGELGGEDHTGC